jgi:biopolymer transport protein ExbB/TolQ
MLTAVNLNDTLRAVATGLRVPVAIVLLLLITTAILMAGSLVVECFTEHRRMKVKMPVLVDKIKNKALDLEETISGSGLLTRQRNVLHELTRHKELTPDMREALASRLIYEEQSHYDFITRITDFVAKLGPMLGLLGTLIPLGPGLIALGQGDTYSLSNSMLIAFDSTIAGLASAAVCFVISGIRKSWYENYMTALEAAMECILEVEKQYETQS